MSLGAGARGRHSTKKSVVSLRARGGEEDTRVCIPLEETKFLENWMGDRTVPS